MENSVETRAGGRPRSNSKFSFRSQKSDGAKPKIDLTETAEDKKKSRFSKKSKVNPNRALTEPQPSFDALEKPTLPELRANQFRDVYGNVIVDADKTNPGRHRLERPLDTIRAFEAAIDSGHRRRSQAVRAESDAGPGYQTRRTSMGYSSMNEIPHFAPKYSPSHVGYGSRQSTSSQLGYGSRQSPSSQLGYGPRHPPPSQLGYGSRHTSFRGNYEYGHGQFPQPQRRSVAYRAGPVSLPPPGETNEHGVYNSHAYHESHDTVNTAADSNGSQSTEPWGYSTDPSSENSSIDRVHAVKHLDSGDAYGGGYGRGSPMRSPIQEEYWHEGRFQQQDAPQDAYVRPPMPPQGSARPPRGAPPSSYLQAPVQRNIIRLGEGSADGLQLKNSYTAPSAVRTQQPVEKPEKRGSWLKRRFSKNNN